jgi:hypothetical protein
LVPPQSPWSSSFDAPDARGLSWREESRRGSLCDANFSFTFLRPSPGTVNLSSPPPSVDNAEHSNNIWVSLRIYWAHSYFL